ncbi:MAG: hypothetical protein K1X94_14245 [Sandaracinaceae bacterium]|nr:hypothetical protein [Sandaracinaceae bacterium]
MHHAAVLAGVCAQREVTLPGGAGHEGEQRGERLAVVGAVMREDLEESLFRFVEAVADEPRWRRRVQRAMRGALRVAIWESRWLGRDRVLEDLTALATRWGRFRGPRLAKMLDVDPADPRSLGRIQDWEDALLGVTGHWTVEGTSEGRCVATKHETECPFADLGAQDTRICTKLVHGLETATFSAVVPDYHLVPLSRLLSKGDASCTFRHEVPADPSGGPAHGAGGPKESRGSSV